MCGRFALAHPRRLAESGLLDTLAIEVVAPEVPGELAPRHNIAPTQPVLAAVASGTTRDGRRTPRTLALLTWGLVPRWARDASIGRRLVNARAETVATTPAFRDAWARGRRCAVLADHFYEWADRDAPAADPRNGDPGATGRRAVARAPRGARQPYAVRLRGGAPFAFAGLWERWRDPAAADADPLVTCTLVTTTANPLVRPLHERMPVLLTGDALASWLAADTTPEAAGALLRPYDATAMEGWAISPRVNAPAHDDPSVLAPVG